MEQHSFGSLPPVSTLTLGGGGLGMLWGETTVDECVATVHAAVAADITLLDLAPRYGDGKAELVVGEAFGGQLPSGVRVTSKCNLGNAPPERIEVRAAAIHRDQPEAPAPDAARHVLPAFQRRPGRELHRPRRPRCRRADDALCRLRRPRASAVRTLRRRGPDRRLGPDRHRSPRHDHQAPGRTAGAGGGAMHRQPARTRRAG